MSAVIGRSRVTIRFELTFSLKDKRREVKSVVQRVRNRYNAAIAEIETLDDIRIATLGVVVLSTSGAHVDQMLAEIFRFIEQSLDLGILDVIETERFPFDG